MNIQIGNKTIEVNFQAMNDMERCIFALLLEGKKTQLQIARSENWMGGHPKFDKVKTEETTLRQVRKIIRDLRLNHHAPILSSIDGYYVPSSEQEVVEYLERAERTARAQAKSWMVTYNSVKNIFDIKNDYFEQTELQLK